MAEGYPIEFSLKKKDILTHMFAVSRRVTSVGLALKGDGDAAHGTHVFPARCKYERQLTSPDAFPN